MGLPVGWPVDCKLKSCLPKLKIKPKYLPMLKESVKMLPNYTMLPLLSLQLSYCAGLTYEYGVSITLKLKPGLLFLDKSRKLSYLTAGSGIGIMFLFRGEGGGELSVPR